MARQPYERFVLIAPFKQSGFSGHLQTMGQKTRFCSPSNSTALLNLNCSLVFFFNSFFLYFFEKVPKTGLLCPAFGASFAQESLCDIFQSVHTSPLAACHNAWVGKNSLRSNIMPPVSKHCLAAHCASQRCPSALGGELPFAMKIHWHATRTLARKMVMFKNRHHQNHSKKPGKQRKQDKICLSGAYTRCCYCVRSELFCPRCLNEELFAAPLRASNVCDDGSFSSPKECAPALSRPRDVALRLLSKRLL